MMKGRTLGRIAFRIWLGSLFAINAQVVVLERQARTRQAKKRATR